MASATDDPYAPPAAETPPLEDVAGGWSVQGEHLVVREGTVLPEVDLHGHAKGGPLTPMLLNLPVPMTGKTLMAIFIPLALMIGYLSLERDAYDRNGWIGLAVIGLLSPLLLRGVKIRSAPAYVWGYVSVPALRAQTRRARWRGRVTWIACLPLMAFVAAAFGGINVPRSWSGSRFDLMGFGLVAILCLLGGIVGLAVWAALDAGWRCAKARDGWVWIKGLGPLALADLAQRAGRPVPEPVPRKVFHFHLQRLPMSHWIQVNRWSPGAWWQTFRLKLQSAENQERLAFHWSEREWLPPERADAELVAAWTRGTEDTPLAGWRMTHAERMDSPGRCFRSEEIVFLSPDGCHAAISACMRAATGKGLAETREFAFRSWTTDGRILATGDQPLTGALPPELHATVVKGSPGDIAREHFRRVAGEPLVSVDAPGLRRQEEWEMQRRYEAMVAAGIYSDLEEMELPGTPPAAEAFA